MIENFNFLDVKNLKFLFLCLIYLIEFIYISHLSLEAK